MEHPCYKCGATLDEGRAFCPQCNAPQIRVAALETASPASSTVEDAGSSSHGQDASFPPQPAKLDWPQAIRAAALAAALSSVLMVVPMGVFGLGMLAAGALAVLFYRRRNPAVDLTPGMGARLGAVSGVLGFGIFTVVSAVSAVLFGAGEKLRAALMQAIAEAAARNPDAQAQQAFEFFKTPAGLGVVIAAALLFMLVGFLIFSSLGGALGALLLRRRDRR